MIEKLCHHQAGLLRLLIELITAEEERGRHLPETALTTAGCELLINDLPSSGISSSAERSNGLSSSICQ